MVLVVLNAIWIFVFLNRLVTFRISGLKMNVENMHEEKIKTFLHLLLLRSP